MNAVITGGTKGIGRAIVKQFAEKGFNVAFCARNEADLANFKSELEDRHHGRQFIAFSADVSKKDALLAFAEEIKKQWATINVLVNNAGVFIPGKTIDEEEGMLEMMMQTNLYSAYHLTRAILPLMTNLTDNKKAHIFNMSSVAGLKAYDNGGSYSISKFALTGFSKNLREELKPAGIKVSTIYPGATFTASWDGVEVDENRLMKATDIGAAVYDVFTLSETTVVEDIILRPQLGDL